MSARVATIIGIPVKIHYTMLIAFFLIAWTLASGYMPREHPGLSTSTYWLIGLLSAFILFLSVLLHELGHAYVAQRNGVPIIRIMLFIFGGVAQLGSEVPDARTELKIAAAGPIVSYALAGIFGVGFLLTSSMGLGPGVFAALEYALFINALLATFNLVPAFPLDGGRIFRAIVWARKRDFLAATQLSARIGVGFAYLLIMIGLLQILQGSFVGGLWFAFIGWFLKNGAEGSYRQAELADALSELKVRDIMTRDVDSVPPEVSLETLVEQYFWKKKHGGYPVVEYGRLVGLVTIEDVRKTAHGLWPSTSVREVMTPAERLVLANPERKAIDAFMDLSQKNIGRMPVVDGGRLLGIITRSDLVHAIRVRQTEPRQT